MNAFDQFSDARVQHFFDQVYHDRGLMKWQGFYLSDHTAALKQVKAAEHQQLAIQPQQSVVKITQRLAFAYRQHLAVIVQLNQLTAATGAPLPAVQGVVQGYHEETVYIGGQPLALALIRHVKVLSADPAT